jgi:hypothetical protein
LRNGQIFIAPATNKNTGPSLSTSANAKVGQFQKLETGDKLRTGAENIGLRIPAMNCSHVFWMEDKPS